MVNINKWVIAKTPRNKPFLVLGVFWFISTLALLMEYYFILPDLLSFDGVNVKIKLDSSEIKGIACISFVFMTISFSLSAIRNNTKSQPVESLIFLFGVVWFVFLFFSQHH